MKKLLILIFLLIPGFAFAEGDTYNYYCSEQPSFFEPDLGAFSDPFISIQLAGSPIADRILATDGTNNSWIVNSGGGGGTNDWVVIFPNALSPTSTNDLTGLFINASSTFNSTLRGNATSTWLGGMVIGTSTPHDVKDSSLLVVSKTADEHTLIVMSFPGQTEHIFMGLDSDENILWDFEANGQFNIFHTAVAPGERGAEFICDAATFGDTICLQIDFTVGAIGAEDEEAAQVVNIEGSATTGGIVFGTVYAKTAGGGAEFWAIGVSPGYGVIRQSVGTFVDVDFAWKFVDSGSSFTDVTAAFNSTVTDVDLWEANNDIVYVGGSSPMDVISWIFSSVGTKNLNFEFAHSVSGGAFDVFELLDETDGGTKSNAMIIDDELLTNWAANTVNGQSFFWVRIKRQQAGNHTTPTEDKVQIVKDAIHFTWDIAGNLDVLSATTSGHLIVGTTVPPNELSVGDLFVGNNATVTGNLTVNTQDFVVDITNGNIGIGTASLSDAGNDIWRPRVYIFAGANSGSAGCNTVTILCLEGSNNLGMQFLTPNDKSFTIYFGDENSNSVGSIVYNHSNNEMSLTALGTGGVIHTDGFKPSSDSAKDLGISTRFWDEIYGDEIVLQEGTMGATAANQTRLAGLDLSGGDAGLHIKTENDTEHIFASWVGFNTTTPQSILHVTAGTSATTTITLAEVGDNTSRTCFMVNNSEGELVGFYIDGGNNLVIDPNGCQ